ncbi:hypothetical protein AC782_06275 [Helicobacter pylori]|uniref:hypothetical protein n=1 Tax=Helicobacter pylori TaxID=210 RepID=UPI000681FFE1|nr:hypothetical protein [Helicobacter pylori]KMZ46147.1 hypothetical protein AC782_06275 [Helicobacter pylori]
MAYFIFSVAVVFLWLVAWGIYLVFGKRLKEEMKGIENSDPNQNNPFITAAVGIGGAAISIFSQIPNQSLMASSRWLRKVCKRRLEKTNSQRGKKF